MNGWDNSQRGSIPRSKSIFWPYRSWCGPMSNSGKLAIIPPTSPPAAPSSTSSEISDLDEANRWRRNPIRPPIIDLNVKVSSGSALTSSLLISDRQQNYSSELGCCPLQVRFVRASMEGQ